MSDFENRVVVITGGASGIGAALARAFAARGAKLVLADIDEPALARMLDELKGAGHEAHGVPTDVRDPESVRALSDAAFAHFSAVHIVCNNAGVALGGPLLEATAEDWKFMMDIDFWGVVHGIRAFVPRMIEQAQGGHVLATSSMAGMVGMQWLGVYCAAKFGVVGVIESLARELKPHGIGASVVCPMIVETNIGTNSTRLRARQGPGEALPDPPGSVQMSGSVIDADQVAQRVIRGIERKDLYIFTHPEQRDILRRRAARIDAMFADDVWPL